jgi:opacity protein-like surface antigen
MIKKMTAGLAIVALSSSLYATNVTVGTGFVGLEVGNTTLQAARYMNIWDGDTYNPFFEGSGVELGIKLGAQSDEWRTALAIDYYDNEDEDQNYEKALVLVDYFLVKSESTEMNIQPYIGVNVGYMAYESTFIDESDFVYGGQAGLVVNIDNIDLDLSYRYSLFNGDSADEMGTIMLGINYLY